MLLVEDDPALNDLVSQMLQELGAIVVRATSAGHALQAASDTAFDLVLSDMVMPGEMDGLDLARELRKLYGGVPVVLMTGYSTAAGLAAEEGRAPKHDGASRSYGVLDGSGKPEDEAR